MKPNKRGGIRCIKCKASPPYVVLNELWSGGGIQFEQSNSGRSGREGYSFDPCTIDGVFAHCTQCDHTYKLRGINSINDLEGPDEAK